MCTPRHLLIFHTVYSALVCNKNFDGMQQTILNAVSTVKEKTVEVIQAEYHSKLYATCAVLL